MTRNEIWKWATGVASVLSLGASACSAEHTADDSTAPTPPHDVALEPGRAEADPEPGTSVIAVTSAAEHEVAPRATGCQCAQSGRLQALRCDALGPEDGLNTMPLLNDDGSSIALSLSVGPDWRPFHWTAAEGGKELPLLSGGSASGLSSDGRSVLLSPRVVLGTEARLYRADADAVDTGLQSTPVLLSGEGTAVGLTWTPAGTPNLTRWTVAGGLEVLSELDLDARELLLWGTSADGSVITGGGPRGREYVLFRWSDADGLEFGLPLPAGASSVSFAALSRDGRSIAGHVFDASGATSVYRWTKATGVVELARAADPVVPFINDSFVALSDDGSVLAGSQRNSSSPSQAFRWSEQTGVVLLTPGFDSEVHAMNTDGSIIIGMAADDAPFPIFIWTAEHGARNLGLALEQNGVDLSGWSLTPLLRFSRDGKVAVGWGSCGGAAVPYRLVLPD